MATIIANGCFDLLHAGHITFLSSARNLGWPYARSIENHHRLVVAVNSDASARKLKTAKWGEKYPIHSDVERIKNVAKFADEVVCFDTEQELHDLIEFCMPCIIVKGPDYAGKCVTGDDLAPVIILDTPEPKSVKEQKIKVYGQLPQTLK